MFVSAENEPQFELFALGSYGIQEFSYHSEQKRSPLCSVVSHLNEAQILTTY
jgi:hypothetical protein